MPILSPLLANGGEVKSTPSLIGLEATGNSQWFINLLDQLGHEVRVGDAAEIRASCVRRQKNDRRDAGHVLKLLREVRFRGCGCRARSSAICSSR